jgi:solute carrier family 1 (glial high affinity glutamate transporter), member 2
MYTFLFEGVIVFCITFGIIIGAMGEKAKVMCAFFSELNEIIMRIVNIIMWSVIKT